LRLPELARRSAYRCSSGVKTAKQRIDAQEEELKLVAGPSGM